MAKKNQSYRKRTLVTAFQNGTFRTQRVCKKQKTCAVAAVQKLQSPIAQKSCFWYDAKQ